MLAFLYELLSHRGTTNKPTAQTQRISLVCIATFQKVKGILTHHPVLATPDFTKLFNLAVDTSDIRVGIVLPQDYDTWFDYLECYFSKKFINA